MKTFRILVSLLLVGAILIGCDRTGTTTQKFGTVDVTGAPWGRDFQLIDHHGKARAIADFKGKAVLLFFGYTNCPDVCPTTMAKLATVMEKIGKDAERVQVLMVSLDPKRDTPELLSKYVPAFHPTFLGLTGDEAQVDSAVKEFKAVRVLQKPDSNGFYTVDHSGGAYVIDPQGRLRLLISDGHSVEVIAQDLHTLLKA